MNKTAIKNFAVWARQKLIADITYKAGLIGVSEKGIAEPLSQSTKDMQFFDIGTKNYAEVTGSEIVQRNALVSAIKAKERDTDYKTAFQNVVEEVAYTWFNRLIAVRFMEVNDYLPSRVRVLSSTNFAKAEPDFVTTPFDTDLEFTPYEQNSVLQLKDENKLDELFRMLFIKQCIKLNDILPELFEKTDDYSELLLTISFTDKDGIVYHLTHDIAEDDFNVSGAGQVEIIGWMYQYYNTEPKDEVFALLKKNVKITKERIPAATQLFTPDWIVRYMVENSLGRIVISEQCSVISDEKERIAKEKEIADKMGWKYYLPEAEQTEEVRNQLNSLTTDHLSLSTLKIIDPCMGSGHILVYAFDVLMQIYAAQGYVERDAAKSIVENNLYGLDIDKRAYQLAYFAVMMKARQYNRRILNGEVKPNLYAIDDSSVLTSSIIDFISTGNGKLKRDLQSISDDLCNAKEYGSIIDVAAVDVAAIYGKIDEIKDRFYEDIFGQGNRRIVLENVLPVIKQAEAMAQKYDVVVTNPPYMGSSGMSAKLSDYVKTNYPDSKSDLFAVFMERCGKMVKKNCYQAMITQHAWMFLSSFEKLRSKLLSLDTVNMAHLGARAFEEIGGEVVQTTSFVLRKSHIKGCKGVYCRLIEPTTQKGKEDMFLAGENRYESAQDNFSKIPGSPIAYWVSDSLYSVFERENQLNKNAIVFEGLKTRDNERFLRYWFEIFGDKWKPNAKGGSFRRWYGNNEYVVNWGSNGDEVRSFKASSGANFQHFFEPTITYSALTSYKFSGRYINNSIFGGGGGGITNSQITLYLLGFVNSIVFHYLMNILSQTLNFEVGQIGKQPVLIGHKQTVDVIVDSNISLARSDWDSFETSWDFIRHPLVELKESAGYGADMSKWQHTIKGAYHNWESLCEQRFNTLKANEEELNRIFIDIYGLQDELTPEVEDKDVTVRKADLQRDIKSLISYAVGCMLGRYSLDADGLAYAGGEWNNSKYKTYLPDADNCLPITDEAYFEDDIVGRLVEFVKVVYGKETLEENLDFIAQALGNKGDTSREIIRNYFLNDFIKDHIKIYQKRPIYWLFDSGKQNGFKALIYMHRWNADTVGNLRVEYLHKIQRTYESEIIRMQEVIDNSHDSREVARATRRKDKLQKQLKETKDYDAMLAHIALSRIEIGLDDGVKVNYEKVQTGRDGKKMKILAKI